jgi:hypothetical protein
LCGGREEKSRNQQDAILAAQSTNNARACSRTRSSLTRRDLKRKLRKPLALGAGTPSTERLDGDDSMRRERFEWSSSRVPIALPFDQRHLRTKRERRERRRPVEARKRYRRSKSIEINPQGMLPHYSVRERWLQVGPFRRFSRTERVRLEQVQASRLEKDEYPIQHPAWTGTCVIVSQMMGNTSQQLHG